MRVLDGFDIFLRDLVFEFGHVAGGLHLGDGALQAQGFFGDLVAGGFCLLFCLECIGIGGFSAGALRGVEKRDA